MRKSLTALASTLLLVGAAEAALVDRGGGMIYDTTLNITWLADMNYALTSGFVGSGLAPSSDPRTDWPNWHPDAIWTDGRMGWNAAQRWADSLVYGGYSDWRLPTLNASDTTCSDSYVPYGGGFPRQYFGNNCTGGELSHLFVADLGNKAGESVLNQAGDTAEQIANLALFSNVQTNFYWASTEYEPSLTDAWVFMPFGGGQTNAGKLSAVYAVAVRPGDVIASVPEPATLALVGAALLGVVTTHRRKPAATP